MLRAEQAINEHVAARIRARRKLFGMTQKQLAQRIGVSPQQTQRIELGQRRISVGVLYLVADALNTSTAHFFDRASEAMEQAGVPARRG